jgi:hypothetical protein
MLGTTSRQAYILLTDKTFFTYTEIKGGREGCHSRAVSLSEGSLPGDLPCPSFGSKNRSKIIAKSSVQRIEANK